jgi:hypothetical protein
MCLVWAKKLIALNIKKPWSIIMVVVVVVAVEVTQVWNDRKLPVGFLVDGGEPVEVAIADKWVPV